MKNIPLKLFILFAVASNIALTSIANAGTVALSFEKVIVPEAPPVASVMVAYMNIKNNSNRKQTITEIISPQFKRVEIHKMSMANGMMDMKQLKTLPIQAKKTIVLETGGLHIMLIKPIKPLKNDDEVELTFKLLSGELTTVSTHVKQIDLTNTHQHH